MSAGNDFWAAAAGREFLAAVKSIAKCNKEKNELIQAQNDLLAANNKLLKEQIETTLEAIETLKYLRH